MPPLKRVRVPTKESPPRKATKRETSLKDKANTKEKTKKDTTTKGTPMKGTPTKGTPTKGTPTKTLPPKAKTAPKEREITHFVSPSDLKLTITLYPDLPITYEALSYCLAGAHERANSKVKDDLTPNEPMYYPMFGAESASNDTEPASHDTETASNDTEPASHDTEMASNNTEPASNDTEPASNDTEPPLQFSIVGDIRWGKNKNQLLWGDVAVILLGLKKWIHSIQKGRGKAVEFSFSVAESGKSGRGELATGWLRKKPVYLDHGKLGGDGGDKLLSSREFLRFQGWT
ncbi:MAG: hypothetical protein Q9221_004592 [Calogaya cf. arnoldii]